MIIKVALGVFLGILLWNKRDFFGVLLFALIALLLAGRLLIYIFKNVSNYIDQLGLRKDCINLAEDLKFLGFAEDMGVQSLALMLERYEHRWKIYTLISDVDKFKRRKANGYDCADECENIERSFKSIIKNIKNEGWGPI